MSFSSTKEWVGFFRDIGIILGVPGIIFVGYKLFNRHIIALKDAHNAHIDALESENKLLKETQYDRAFSLLEAQKKLFQKEREMLEGEIANLKLEKETQEKVTKLISLFSDSTSNAMNELAKILSDKELRHLEPEAWEDFLDMAISAESLLKSFNMKPKRNSSKD